jgi:hypothetical protein
MQEANHSAGASLELKDSSLLRQANLIGGEWVQAADGGAIPVTNLANGTVIGRVPSLSRAEVAGAINIAYSAQKAWRAKTAEERASILRRLFERHALGHSFFEPAVLADVPPSAQIFHEETSVQLPLSSALRPKGKQSSLRTTRSSVSQPISTTAMLGASSVSSKRLRRASLPSTRA